jgi:hypothetical protein
VIVAARRSDEQSAALSVGKRRAKYFGPGFTFDGGILIENEKV